MKKPPMPKMSPTGPKPPMIQPPQANATVPAPTAPVYSDPRPMPFNPAMPSNWGGRSPMAPPAPPMGGQPPMMGGGTPAPQGNQSISQSPLQTPPVGAPSGDMPQGGYQ